MQFLKAIFERLTTPDLSTVEARRKYAHESGAADAFASLYYDLFKYAPSWFANEQNRSWFPPAISEAVGGENDNPIRLKVNGGAYVVTRQQKSPPGYSDADYTDELELQIDGQLRLGIRIDITTGEYADSRDTPYVTAFVPGPWVRDFVDLSREVKVLHKRRLEESMKEFEAKQAKRFGL